MADYAWLEHYIQKDVELKGGHFLFFDEKTQDTLVLNFHGVHPYRVHKTGPNNFVACVDMRSRDGREFDLDFFIHRDENGQTLTRIAIHQAEGHPRYAWYKDQGISKQRPVCQM